RRRGQVPGNDPEREDEVLAGGDGRDLRRLRAGRPRRPRRHRFAGPGDVAARARRRGGGADTAGPGVGAHRMTSAEANEGTSDQISAGPEVAEVPGESSPALRTIGLTKSFRGLEVLRG